MTYGTPDDYLHKNRSKSCKYLLNGGVPVLLLFQSPVSKGWLKGGLSHTHVLTQTTGWCHDLIHRGRNNSYITVLSVNKSAPGVSAHPHYISDTVCSHWASGCSVCLFSAYLSAAVRLSLLTLAIKSAGLFLIQTATRIHSPDWLNNCLIDSLTHRLPLSLHTTS